MTLRLDEPWWLCLMALSVPAAWMAVRGFVSMSLPRRVVAALARATLLTLLALALAGATQIRRADRVGVVAVVDVSGSVMRLAPERLNSSGRRVPVREDLERFLLTVARQRGERDLFGVVVFDGRALAGVVPTTRQLDEILLDIPPTDGSDYEDALRFASALLPGDAAKRLILIGDGNETTGSVGVALSRLLGEGGIGETSGVPVRIDTAPISYTVRAETMVESVDAPSNAAPDSVVNVRVTLISSTGARGTLRLRYNDQEEDLAPDAPGRGLVMDLPRGRTTQILPVRLGRGRIHQFQAVWEPELDRTDPQRTAFIGDTSPENNTGRSYTLSVGEGRILAVDGSGEGSGAMSAALDRAGLRTTTVPPEGFPPELLELEEYDLVVLYDVPADAMGTGSHGRLSAYVRELGGGLLMVGGPGSFGAGGWKGTEVEPLLPVTLDLPEKLIRPESAVIFVLDRSGSMGFPVFGSSRSKQEIANESAALAVRTLDPADLVGVIAFSSFPDVVVPLTPNADPDATAGSILGIRPGGGTELSSALELAASALQSCDAKVKHIIVLSDGRAVNAELLPGQAGSIHDLGITLSTIAIGEEADTDTLDAMALNGGGTFYNVVNPNMLPRVFVRAVRIVRSPMLREEPFVPVITDQTSPVLSGLSAPPRLDGLVMTQHGQGAGVVTPIVSDRDEPVLAYWSVGLGKVGAFTSDAHRWGRAWASWGGFSGFWVQLARQLARPAGPRGLDLRLIRDGDRLTVRFNGVDDAGVPLDLLTVPVSVYGPDGRQELTLSQIGPGAYEGQAHAGAPGVHLAIATPRRSGVPIGGVSAGLVVPMGVEYRRLSSNDALMRSIAQRAGGRVLDLDGPEPPNLFEREDLPTVEARQPLWPTLLMLSIIAFVADVGTRRIAWDRWIGETYRTARAEQQRTARLREGLSLGALRGIKQRASRRVGAPESTEQHDTAQRPPARSVRRVGTPSDRPTQTGQTSTERGEEPSSGLLAAKRRARRRYEDDGDTTS